MTKAASFSKAAYENEEMAACQTGHHHCAERANAIMNAL
jgi:hypothetical protein